MLLSAILSVGPIRNRAKALEAERSASGLWRYDTDMIRASERSYTMPASPIRRLVPYAVAAEKRGVHVHYMNIGQPDIASPDSFWKGVQSQFVKTLEYSPSPGIPALREAALADYARRGIPVEAKDLLITSGGSEATLFALLSCFNPGDELLVVEPYYANYLGFAVEAGIKLKAITTHLDADFQLPSPSTIAAEITPSTKGILICNPSNPTGGSFSSADLRALANIAIEKNLFLIVDEVYRDFNYTENELLSVMSLPELEDRAVMIDSLSKRYSLCGARIGFLVSKNADVIAGANKLAQARLAAATLEQAGAAQALRDTPLSYFGEVNQEYRARRDLTVRLLRTIPGVKVPRIDGAFYALIELPVPDVETFCIWMLENFNHNGETLLMAPAEGFYLTPGLGKNQARLAYVLEQPKIERALECLRQGLASYPAALAPAGS